MKTFLDIVEWLERRTGAIQGVKTFLNEQIPSSVGWRNTLGSLAGAFLLIQILTGFLLTIYYVPHPDAAFDSLTWVSENVTLGALTRALHYWGTSFIIVALFVHMVRVFLSGAYKKPREVNWLVGLALFAVVLALAFTGQLLPFNQMGYWAAKVGIEMGSSAPFIGAGIRRLFMGGDTVGALTLTRFYALHVVLLPGLLGLLVVLHLSLLRRHGPVRPADDSGQSTEPFFPLQFARDMVMISIGLAALCAVALIFEGPHSPRLDLTDTSYLPRPEWYFLSHFEILKWTEGEFQKVIAAFILPNLLFLALAVLPWLDRGPSVAVRERRGVVVAGLFVVASIVGLTAFGFVTAPEQAEEADTMAVEEEVGDDPLKAVLASGRRVYRELDCPKCHRINGRGNTKGPDLSGVGLRLQEDYLRKWLLNPQAFIHDAVMPPAKTSDEKFEALVFYLMSLHVQPEL